MPSWATTRRWSGSSNCWSSGETPSSSKRASGRWSRRRPSSASAGAYRLTRPIQTIQVPATVHVILAARIERLPARDKQLLQTASVIGKDVPVALLHAVADARTDEVDRTLAHLQAAEFLYETHLFPDTEYTFKHALTHEVTYGTLLEDQRKDVHARTVSAIERVYPDRLTEHVERLAHHAVRGELWEQAVTYLRQAGLKALERSANREAVSCFEDALRALERLPADQPRLAQGVDCRIEPEHALMGLGHFRRSLAVMSDAEVIARRLEDQARLGRVYARMTYNLGSVGDLDAAVEKGEQAVALLAQAVDGMATITTNLVVARSYYGLGDYRRTIETVQRNEVMAATTRDAQVAWRALASAPFWFVVALAEVGEFDVATARAEAHIASTATSFGPHEHVVALLGAGRLYLLRGQVDRAIEVLEPGMPLCEPGSERELYFAPMAASLGVAYALADRSAEALGLLERAVASAVSIGYAYTQPNVMTALGEARLLAGQTAAAGAIASDAVEVARRQKQRGYEAWALRVQGNIALAGGAPGDAELPLPRGDRARGTARHATAPRPLPARARRGRPAAG